MLNKPYCSMENNRLKYFSYNLVNIRGPSDKDWFQNILNWVCWELNQFLRPQVTHNIEKKVIFNPLILKYLGSFLHRKNKGGFLGTFLVKKNVETKLWHKMQKFKRQILAYEIWNFCMLIRSFRKNLAMNFRGFKKNVENDKFFTLFTVVFTSKVKSFFPR
jgi:hypothetical protein